MLGVAVERGGSHLHLHHHPIRISTDSSPSHSISTPPLTSTSHRLSQRHPPSSSLLRHLTRLRLLALLSSLSIGFLLLLSYLALSSSSPSSSPSPLYRLLHSHSNDAPPPNLTHRTPYNRPIRVPQVCAHKAFLPPNSTSSPLLADTFPPPPPTIPPHPLHASPPMLPHSMVHFLRVGVSCFDLDLFLTADDVLFMGHPTDTAAYLTSLHPPSQPFPPPPPLLYVETLTAAQIEALDPAGYVPRWSVVVEVLMRELSVPSEGRASLSFVTVETKGRLNSAEGYVLVASAFAALEGPLAGVFLLLADRHLEAAQVQRLYPSVPLVLPMRDRNMRRESTAGTVCDGERSRAEREAVMRPYKWLWPSYKIMLTCGRDREGGADVLQEARKKGKIVGTWYYRQHTHLPLHTLRQRFHSSSSVCCVV